MLKRIMRIVTVLLLVSLLVFVPVILSSLNKSGETISFQTVDSGETDQITRIRPIIHSQDFVSDMKKVAENSKYCLYAHQD